MKLFGLIGYPLTHSFSKKYFSDKFHNENIDDCSYDLFELKSADELPALISSKPNLAGLNVTIPHKEAVLPYMHSMDESAKKVGAVNVIKIDNGHLEGYNSDYYGFLTSLNNLIGHKKLRKAIVLGTGGASKAVIAVLNDLDMQVTIVSRSSDKSNITYDQLSSNDLIEQAELIINTTPLGMHPNIDTTPDIPYEMIKAGCFVFDLIYNPAMTKFMKLASEQGAIVKNGLEMLELQAEKSWEIWAD